MSNNETNKQEYLNIINDIPKRVKDVVLPLAKGAADAKSNIAESLKKLAEKKIELKAAQAIATVQSVDEPSDVSEEIIVAAAPRQEQQSEIEKPVVTATESEVNKTEETPKPVVETPKTPYVKSEKKGEYKTTYINNDTSRPRTDRPAGQGGFNRDNRPAGQGGFNRDNRPAGQGGFNRDNRPQGGGFNRDNRPQGGGFNRDNRPQGGGFGRPRPPFGATAAMAPPPVQNTRDKKKKTPFGKNDDNKKAMTKRSLVLKGYLGGDMSDDETVRYIKNRKKKESNFTPNNARIESAVITTQRVPIKTLAEKIGITAIDIVKKLFLMGQQYTINDVIDYEEAELVAIEYNITLEQKIVDTAETKLAKSAVKNKVAVGDKRPPVVTVMGHVDHGKTSLLDRIRQTSVTAGEAGGITQHIGAYTINLDGETITFLDTPGHEAFTSMRKRGAQVTDVAIIVVAADDGIMPQTVEAISHAKGANVSIIVAVNKMDKYGATMDTVMQQLTQHDIIPMDWGGDVIVDPVSAKTGEGVNKLLEDVLLLAEMAELKAVKDCEAEGVIIEARLDKGTGPVATVLVQNGTLKVGDYMVAGTALGKVRAMIDDKGNRVVEAYPSYAVSVLGFSDVPNAGDLFSVVADEKLAKKVAQERAVKEREDMSASMRKNTLEDMFKDVNAGDVKNLNVIIKADVQGSAEAVKQAMNKLSEKVAQDGVSVNVLHCGVGAINESDVMLADTGKSIVIGFNVRPDPKAKNLADKNGVDIKIYRVIYDAIKDVELALDGMLEPVIREEILGHAEIKTVFKITGVGAIAGCMVTDGKVSKAAHFRLIRDNVVVYDGSISSLKRNKDDVKEVVLGYECGIGLQGYNDLKVGDTIEAFLVIEEKKHISHE